MGLDDDRDCPHDWQLDEIHKGDQPGFVPRLDTVYVCEWCGAVSYAAAREGDLPPGAGAT